MEVKKNLFYFDLQECTRMFPQCQFFECLYVNIAIQESFHIGMFFSVREKRREKKGFDKEKERDIKEGMTGGGSIMILNH